MSYRGQEEWEEYIEQEIDERGLTLDADEREKVLSCESHEEVTEYLDSLFAEREHEAEISSGVDKVD